MTRAVVTIASVDGSFFRDVSVTAPAHSEERDAVCVLKRVDVDVRAHVPEEAFEASRFVMR